MVTRLSYRVDIHTLSHDSAERLEMNDIGRVSVRVLKSLVFDHYDEVRATGGFILIDESTNQTVAAGMICR